ncbi:Hypothetical_protein [Hexamita inflata]|uniref:Hypothetical_protein n=1 Tax=Hexamita inflata TaxID=28002 RepID=A0AA86TSI2_9EUKA|nr:Hypothetical protein HINF_LOCUS8403 [Hexamita inflata]
MQHLPTHVATTLLRLLDCNDYIEQVHQIPSFEIIERSLRDVQIQSFYCQLDKTKQESKPEFVLEQPIQICAACFKNKICDIYAIENPSEELSFCLINPEIGLNFNAIGQVQFENPSIMQAASKIIITQDVKLNVSTFQRHLFTLVSQMKQTIQYQGIQVSGITESLQQIPNNQITSDMGTCLNYLIQQDIHFQFDFINYCAKQEGIVNFVFSQIVKLKKFENLSKIISEQRIINQIKIYDQQFGNLYQNQLKEFVDEFTKQEKLVSQLIIVVKHLNEVYKNIMKNKLKVKLINTIFISFIQIFQKLNMIGCDQILVNECLLIILNIVPNDDVLISNSQLYNSFIQAISQMIKEQNSIVRNKQLQEIQHRIEAIQNVLQFYIEYKQFYQQIQEDASIDSTLFPAAQKVVEEMNKFQSITKSKKVLLANINNTDFNYINENKGEYLYPTDIHDNIVGLSPIQSFSDQNQDYWKEIVCVKENLPLLNQLLGKYKKQLQLQILDVLFDKLPQNYELCYDFLYVLVRVESIICDKVESLSMLLNKALNTSLIMTRQLIEIVSNNFSSIQQIRLIFQQIKQLQIIYDLVKSLNLQWWALEMLF